MSREVMWQVEPVAWQVNVQTPSGPIVYGVYDNAKPGEHLKAACKDSDIVVTSIPLYATPQQAQPEWNEENVIAWCVARGIEAAAPAVPAGWVMVPRHLSVDQLERFVGHGLCCGTEPMPEAVIDAGHRWARLLEKIAAAPAVQPLTDEQINEMCGEANRGFCIERDDYRKAVRDTEQAHGIAAPGSADHG